MLFRSFMLVALWVWTISSPTFAQTEASSPAQEIDRWGSVPIVDEEPYYLLPRGYSMKASFEQNRPGVYVIGFYRDGRNASDWKELISVTAFQGIPRKAGPPALLVRDFLASNIKASCPNDFFYEPIEKGTELRAGAIMGCRNLTVPNFNSRYGYFLFVQGTKSMFVFARESRQQSVENELPVPRSTIVEWQSDIDKSTICKRGEMCVQFGRGPK